MNSTCELNIRDDKKHTTDRNLNTRRRKLWVKIWNGYRFLLFLLLLLTLKKILFCLTARAFDTFCKTHSAFSFTVILNMCDKKKGVSEAARGISRWLRTYLPKRKRKKNKRPAWLQDVKEDDRTETEIEKPLFSFSKPISHVLSHHQVALSVSATITPGPCIERCRNFPLNTRAVNMR